jgi:hypothetical protein
MDPRRLGSVIWHTSGVVASLYEDGSWTAAIRTEDFPAMAAALIEYYGPKFKSPADAAGLLADLAERRDGEVTLDYPAPSPVLWAGPDSVVQDPARSA